MSYKNEYNIEELKRHIKLSSEQKLKYLEQLNIFLSKAMPEKNKKIWNKLKQQGW